VLLVLGGGVATAMVATRVLLLTGSEHRPYIVAPWALVVADWIALVTVAVLALAAEKEL
jgi:hypothetical protein